MPPVAEVPLSTDNLKKIVFNDPYPEYNPKKIKIIKKEKPVISPKIVEKEVVKTPEPVIDKIEENKIPEKIDIKDLTTLEKTQTSIRLNKLPMHDEDFASSWHYSTQIDKDEAVIVMEYNTYLQILDELAEGKIELPEGFSSKQIASDLKTFILKDFTSKGIKLNTQNSLAHRAFYAHCTKRAIFAIRQGEFLDEQGYSHKRPEIADAIESRVNEILFEKMIKEQ